MGTLIEIQAIGTRRQTLEVAVERAFSSLRQADLHWSHFRTSSLVGWLRAGAGREWVEVDAETMRLVRLSREIHTASQGALDVTVGPLMRAWGFYGTQNRTPTDRDIARALECVGLEKLEQDPVRSRLRLTIPGMSLDFSSIGKGFAVDIAWEAASQESLEGLLINAGGDLRAHGPSPHGSSWLVGVRHPLDPEVLLCAIDLENEAMATSGNYERFVVHGGKQVGHLFDPRDGRPADRFCSVTVLSDTTARADALATALFVSRTVHGEGEPLLRPGDEAIWVEELARTSPGDRPRALATEGLRGRLRHLSGSFDWEFV